MNRESETRYRTEHNLRWWADGSLLHMMMTLPIASRYAAKPHMEWSKMYCTNLSSRELRQNDRTRPLTSYPIPERYDLVHGPYHQCGTSLNTFNMHLHHRHYTLIKYKLQKQKLKKTLMISYRQAEKNSFSSFPKRYFWEGGVWEFMGKMGFGESMRKESWDNLD